MCKVFLRLLLISFCTFFFFPMQSYLRLVIMIIMLVTLMKKHCISAVVSVSSCGRDVNKAVLR